MRELERSETYDVQVGPIASVPVKELVTKEIREARTCSAVVEKEGLLRQNLSSIQDGGSCRNSLDGSIDEQVIRVAVCKKGSDGAPFHRPQFLADPQTLDGGKHGFSRRGQDPSASGDGLVLLESEGAAIESRRSRIEIQFLSVTIFEEIFHAEGRASSLHLESTWPEQCRQDAPEAPRVRYACPSRGAERSPTRRCQPG